MVLSFIEKILPTPNVHHFLQQLQSRNNLSVEGLWGSSDNVLSAIAVQHAWHSHKHIVLIAAEFEKYSNVLDDLTELLTTSGDQERWPERKILCYPDNEILPYDVKEPSLAIVNLRQECLETLMSGAPAVIVAHARALLKKIPKPEKLKSYHIELKTGSAFDFVYLTELLAGLGFEKQDVVDQVGTFAVRGGILDVYPFARENPIRIEFFGNDIESIREFDVMSQRSVGMVDAINIYPKSEIGAETFDGSFFDYLDPKALIIAYEPDMIAAKNEEYWEEVKKYYEKARHQNDAGVLLYEDVYWPPDELHGRRQSFQQIHHCRISGKVFERVTMATRTTEVFNGHLKLLREKIVDNRSAGWMTYILCNNSGQLERLDELLDTEQTASGVDYKIGIGELHEGFYFDDSRTAIYTDHQIFGRIKRHRPHRRFKSAQALRHVRSLKPGDYVVHVDHGIAKYIGLEKVTSGEHTEECLKLIYQNGDKLFVPLEHFMRVQKFSGEEGVEPKLNKLGTADWEKLKARTKKTIKDIAQDLIKLYAERQSKKGYAFAEDSTIQYELEASFEFEDTPDQTKVTAEIKKDMESDTPMDRLVCGDVGYGKTEVALRAAFKSVQDSKQVALLVPTTILAEQHFETFSERMKEFPVRIDVLSRFKSTKQQKEALEKLQRGETDILIGTHRLLSKDVIFKDLGLLIIDEEQRFGVVHKEKLKKLRATVDTLTLTATPIPRTLNFSLMGARDLSIMNTPPHDRLPVKTEITVFDERLIHDAILQEIDRGGQVYYVHNRVQSIERVTDTLRQIVPRARFAIVHGQMTPHAIENVVHDFMHRKYDVLVATTIIENGIDIPNVNTIIIDQAHQYGLAQLYQLRGRVGRSTRQAYCYLLSLPFGMLAKDSLKRLQAIEEFTDLGSGFLIAMRDLEIRGAGNLLGSEQSGFINSVGFELYCQLLEEAVAEVKTEHNIPVTDRLFATPQPVLQTHMEVYCNTYIPEDYVNVQSERVRIYKELSEIRSIESLQAIEKELSDRFGTLPDEVKNLLMTLEIKWYAAQFGFERVVVDEHKYALTFDQRMITEKTESDRFRNKMNKVMAASDNFKLHQTEKNLTVTIGFPWYHVQKAKIISDDLPVSDWERLAMVRNFVQSLEASRETLMIEKEPIAIN